MENQRDTATESSASPGIDIDKSFEIAGVSTLKWAQE